MLIDLSRVDHGRSSTQHWLRSVPRKTHQSESGEYRHLTSLSLTSSVMLSATKLFPNVPNVEDITALARDIDAPFDSKMKAQL